MNIKEIEMAITETKAFIQRLEIESKMRDRFLKTNEFLLYHLERELTTEKTGEDLG